MEGLDSHEDRSHAMGMHTEQLRGRTQQMFFEPDADENFVYPDAYDVDFNKRGEIDAGLDANLFSGETVRAYAWRLPDGGVMRLALVPDSFGRARMEARAAATPDLASQGWSLEVE